MYGEVSQFYGINSPSYRIVIDNSDCLFYPFDHAEKDTFRRNFSSPKNEDETKVTSLLSHPLPSNEQNLFLVLEV